MTITDQRTGTTWEVTPEGEEKWGKHTPSKWELEQEREDARQEEERQRKIRERGRKKGS